MVVNKDRIEFARKSMEIDARYDNQDVSNGTHGRYRRRNWTSAQKRRIRKQKNKYRRRFLGEF